MIIRKIAEMNFYKSQIILLTMISCIGVMIALLNNPKLAYHPPPLEIEDETNHLRLAQLRVDMPILALHHPQAVLKKFTYPKSRNFSDQAIGVGLAYELNGQSVNLYQVYRDLDPLTHAYTDYQSETIGTMKIKVKSRSERHSYSSLIWFHDAGVYRLEGKTDLKNLQELLMTATIFTKLDEEKVALLSDIKEGERL